MHFRVHRALRPHTAAYRAKANLMITVSPHRARRPD